MSRSKNADDPQMPSAIRKVLLGKMTMADAQRPLRPARVGKLISEMDLDQLGVPVLSEREGKFYILDGQHRIEALKDWLGPGWETQAIECRVYHGLTPKQEADKFDRLNDILPVNAFDRFQVRVKAGREVEVAIMDILNGLGLGVSVDKREGTLCCVGALRAVYIRSGGEVLKNTIQILRDAYGDPGLLSVMVSGISQLVDRYKNALSRERATVALANVRGGMNAVLGAAHVLRKQTGNQLGPCIAAAAVDVINRARPRGTPKLPQWWSARRATAPSAEEEDESGEGE